MKRVISLLFVALICGGVYYTRIAEARATLAAFQPCYSWPHDPQAVRAACAGVLATASIDDVWRGEALFFTALSYGVEGDDTSALRAYNKAQPLIPDRRSLYYNRANLHGRAGRFDLALVDAEKVRNDWPELRDDAWFRNLVTLSDIHEAQDRPKAALEALSAVLRDRPDDLRTRKRRVRLTAAPGVDWPQPETLLRLRDLTALINHDPDDHAYLRDRAEVFGKLQLALHAVGDAQRALELLRSQPGHQNGASAVISDGLGSTVALIEATISKRIARQCENVSDIACIEDRITGFWQAGRPEAAIAELRRLQRLQPQDPQSAELLAFLRELNAVLDALRLPPPEI